MSPGSRRGTVLQVVADVHVMVRSGTWRRAVAVL